MKTVESKTSPRGLSSSTNRRRPSDMGLAIAIGAGIGMILGLMIDNPLTGMLMGAGLGVIAGAIRN